MDTELGTSETMMTGIKGGEELAKRRAEKHDFELVVCIYADGSSETEPALATLSRPQDFATRKAWVYYCVAVSNDVPLGPRYLVHFYIDVPCTEEESVEYLEMFNGRFPVSYHRQPMAPSDGLQEDDFWNHERLGEPTWFDDDEEDDDWDDAS